MKLKWTSDFEMSSVKKAGNLATYMFMFINRYFRKYCAFFIFMEWSRSPFYLDDVSASACKFVLLLKEKRWIVSQSTRAPNQSEYAITAMHLNLSIVSRQSGVVSYSMRKSFIVLEKRNLTAKGNHFSFPKNCFLYFLE